ncbi:MAG: hypothetical protein LQ347_006175, partial [Umbilicaria vellea]
MVLPAQFQLALELTNIVNPLGTALSKLSSLAIIDVVKRSGADVITEMKLASLLGRHRIDPVMEYSFKAVVAKSNQSTFSRYIDIVLESGAGPTVQEALKNPALFSMVIQLSLLAAKHTDVSLANVIVTAIENILRDAGASPERAPDYVSLLGTIRACQQQTASFRWAHLYDAVEHKIHRALTSWRNKQQQHANGDSWKEKVVWRWRTETSSIADQSLPFVVFQSLLMWLQSLQSFPEHRILYIRCDTGISTVVVWCHHLLGLNVTVRLDGVDTYFGQGMTNVLVENCMCAQAGASLLDAADQNEPLFSLSETEDDHRLDFEARADAFGYGSDVLKQVTHTDGELRSASHWIVGQVLDLLRSSTAFTEPALRPHTVLNEQRILRAGKFLFALDNLDQRLVETSIGLPPPNSEIKLPASGLYATLITFARIHGLEGCMNLPLSINVCYRYQTRRNTNNRFGFPGGFDRLESYSGHPDCFDHLSRLLLGHCYTQDYVKSAVLISGWGWSIFYNTVDAIDPVDVSLDFLQVMPGVPSRQGLRKTRILDGPAISSTPVISGVNPEVVAGIEVLPGISTSKRGPILLGYQGTDAFSVSQSFEWNFPDGSKCKDTVGFLEMREICSKFKLLQTCSCGDMLTDEIDWIDRHTMDSDNTMNSDIVYYPTERILPTLQNHAFEKVEPQDLQGNTVEALVYCHSMKWTGSSPSGSSASFDERIFVKHVVSAVGQEDVGMTGITAFDEGESSGASVR